jgi:hypothetical protein
MQDLDKALAEINAIRSQMARDTQFHGYGAATFVATGVLAGAAAVGQAVWLPNPAHSPLAYLTLWVVVAAVSIGVIGLEMVTRTRRIHTGLADEMIHAAVEHFLPAAVCGALLTLVLVRAAPASLWMLPGLWQMIFGLGVFASCQFLPRAIIWVGVWYVGAGLASVALGGGGQSFAPWVMGAPFAVGQLMVAAILHLTSGGERGRG